MGTDRLMTVKNTTDIVEAHKISDLPFSNCSGTVTSVGIAGGGGITISGSPITSSGTITLTNSDRGSSHMYI